MSEPNFGVGNSLLMLTAAKVWVTALSILAVPLYLRYLGIEAYGVIGFFAAMQSALLIFDFGLSTTVTKKLAQVHHAQTEIKKTRDLLRTAEVISLSVSITVLLLFAVFAQTISADWSVMKQGQPLNMTLVVCVAAAALVAQWPSTLYSAALNGLHQIKVLSFSLALFALFRTVLAVLLAWWSRDLSQFFLAQFIVSGLQTIWLRRITWLHMKGQHKPVFCKQSVLDSAKFTGDIAVISVVSLALTQVDKLLLSQRLSLADFGVYALAATAAAGLYVLANPFFSAVFPYFSRLMASTDKHSLERAYRRVSELMACGLLPLAAVLIVVPYQVLWVWTGDQALAQNAAPVLRILTFGTVINAMLLVPYAYQIASGETRLALYMTGIAALISLPALWFSSYSYGVLAAAWVWTGVNLGLLFAWPFFMHRIMLHNDMLRWYCLAVTIPLICSVCVQIAMMSVFPNSESRLTVLCILVASAIVNFCMLTLILPNARRGFVDFIASKNLKIQSSASKK